MPNISVIVPVYKVEPYLSRCVNSILTQTYRDFELILVDDGSPDRCGEMCEDYARADSRVRVIHQENGGLSAARNTGIDWVFANSDSRWLAFVDSDDWVHPAFLQTLYSAAEQTLCKLSVCGIFRTAGEEIPGQQEDSVQCLSADDFYCSDIEEGLAAVAWNKLYHRSLFKTLRYPIGKLHEDEFTTYRAVYQAEKVGVSTARLYAYYQNPEGIMRSEWNVHRMDVLEAFEQRMAFARETDRPRLLRKTAEAYIYGICEQLDKAQVIYRKELRRKLRNGLKLGRECGCFPRNGATLWAYEKAYPVKPLWWLVSKLSRGGGEA